MAKSKSNRLNISSPRKDQFNVTKNCKKLAASMKNKSTTFGKTSRKTEIQEIMDRYQYKNLPDLDMERAYKFKYGHNKCVVDLSSKEKNISRLKAKLRGKPISSTRRLENFINMHDNKDVSKISS